MNLGIIGTGYVGLVHGTVMADMGNTVICTDVDATRIQALNQLRMPVYEPGLETLVRKNVAAGRLSFTNDLTKTVLSSDILFSCVGTPPLPDGSADLSAVFAVAENVAHIINKHAVEYRLLVNKSTIPPGTTDEVTRKLAHILQPNNFDVAMNPEFLKQGDAVNDSLKPDRVVIGVSSSRARSLLEALYAPFVKNDHPIRIMTPKDAELVKYYANTLLAIRLSSINEFANLCDALGANIRNILPAVTDDVRIGKYFAHPSGGYGGSCFPKDVKALIAAAEKAGIDLAVARATDTTNEYQKTTLLHKINLYFPAGITGKTFAVWGLAFKAGTDDIREAPSLAIINGLLEQKAKVQAYDPEAMHNTRTKTSIGDQITYVSRAQDALAGADALVVCTEWPEFRMPNFDFIKSVLKNPVIFDNKSIYPAEELNKKGIAYFGIGSENEIARSYRINFLSSLRSQ